MKIADQIVAWLFILLGPVHLAFTPREATTRAAWFASWGLYVMLTGAINLLRIRYGGAAPGIRVVALAANLVGGGFCLFIIWVTRALVGPPGVALAVFVLAAFFAAGRSGTVTRAQGAA